MNGKETMEMFNNNLAGPQLKIKSTAFETVEEYTFLRKK